MSRRMLLAGLGAPMVAVADVAHTRLSADTNREFEAYLAAKEKALAQQHASGKFLWADAEAGRREKLRAFAVLVEPAGVEAVVNITDGLIHDWIGAVFLPGVTVAQTLGLVQNYANHKMVYQPEVIDSRVTEHSGDRYRVFLKLKKKKVLTVILNTDHEVVYTRVNAGRAWSKSATTRISEVADAEKPTARELPQGAGHGFLWRLNSYWRFDERDGGTYVECEAISLTRGIPYLLRRVITPIVRQLPEESLRNTLLATRSALNK